MPTFAGFNVLLAGGVVEVTQITGTGTYSLDGPATIEGITYRTFVAGVGSGNRAFYTVRQGALFEDGLGTVTAGAPSTISRDLIIKGSNGTNPVSWAPGVKHIFLAAPAEWLNQIVEKPFVNVKRTIFTASGTFTRDAKCIGARIRGVGNGGAGGGTAATGAGEGAEGGGAGGGEYAEGYFTAAQIGASRTITIPAAATGVSGGNGNNGGTVSVVGLITFFGGLGGLVGPDTAGSNSASGGDGGTGGTGGDFRCRGGDGGMARVHAGIPAYQNYGGASLLGSSRRAQGQGNGSGGRDYGGGGSGASALDSEGAHTGGSGAQGAVIFEEFLHP